MFMVDTEKGLKLQEEKSLLVISVFLLTQDKRDSMYGCLYKDASEDQSMYFQHAVKKIF